jgi:hypothetical protein
MLGVHLECSSCLVTYLCLAWILSLSQFFLWEHSFYKQLLVSVPLLEQEVQLVQLSFQPLAVSPATYKIEALQHATDRNSSDFFFFFTCSCNWQLKFCMEILFDMVYK